MKKILIAIALTFSASLAFSTVELPQITCLGINPVQNFQCTFDQGEYALVEIASHKCDENGVAYILFSNENVLESIVIEQVNFYAPNKAQLLFNLSNLLPPTIWDNCKLIDGKTVKY